MVKKKGRYLKEVLAIMVAVSVFAGSTVSSSFAASVRVRIPKWGGQGISIVNNSSRRIADKREASPSEATPSGAIKGIPWTNATGDIWADWIGSMDFLSGTAGEGTKDNPYQISTKAQLMGLAQLTAMGMLIHEGQGTYPGNYSNCSFKLMKNIDLGGLSWIPIGFYQNEAEMTGEIVHAFTGSFDGNGKTISNFKMYKPNWVNTGFFGKLSGAVVENLILRPSASITGNNQVGILAGTIQDSSIRNVLVKGNVRANGIAGGLTGDVKDSVIENCQADITVDSTKKQGNETIFVGGIAGKASGSVIVDCSVSSGNNRASRIQGKGYVGGIVGYQNVTDIYNTEVSGTIGGTGSVGIGGICGLYHAGKIMVARFSGKIGNSGLGSATHEGTFIGTRNWADHFRYGEDVAYLFADTESKIAAGVCGSEIPDDNAYTYDDHIGFWHSGDLFFTLAQGGKTKSISDSYFYQELETGILTVMDHSFAGGTGDGFTIDHFAPNKSGNPARGYLVSVPQIDTLANGSYYGDVASLTVKGSSSYNHLIDKDARGAVMAGDVVTIVTSPNHSEDAKFQIKESGSVPDRTHHYVTYTDSRGKQKASSYTAGGSYTFQMPACDTEVTAVYEKVSTNVEVSPHNYNFKVVQIRTGNRKAPTLTTKVLNNDGKLIATYINGSLQEAQVQPVYISAVVDENNSVADSRVRWSIDDGHLITLHKNGDEDAAGYTGKSAGIKVNLKSRFFTDIIASQERTQADSGYRDKIPDTIFGVGYQSGGIAVLTASTRPDTSFDQIISTDNCRIGVTFQTDDQTYIAGEGAVLDKPALEFEVVRTLTGDRLHPNESIKVTVPQSLTVTCYPDYFSKKDVGWVSSDTSIIQVAFHHEMENNDKSYRYALVSAMKDSKWIKDIIAIDQGIHDNAPYAIRTGEGVKHAVVTVTAKDQLGGIQTASSQIRVVFRTDDQTRIRPEQIILDQTSISYQLSYTKKGDAQSETVSKDGFLTKSLKAVVLPMLSDHESYKPYNQEVIWKSSDSSVEVDEWGNISPVEDAEWIQEAMTRKPYQAEKMVRITAVTKDGEKMAVCDVNLQLQVNCVELDRKQEVFEVVLTAEGSSGLPSYMWTGGDQKKLNAAGYPDQQPILWESGDGDILTVDRDGNMAPVMNAEWMKEAMKRHPYEAEIYVPVYAGNYAGTIMDTCIIRVKFKFADKTYSSGDSSGGGGGGIGSTGITPSGSRKSSSAPIGSVIGTWVQTADNRWTFTAGGRTFANEWAYIHNPYSLPGQDAADWFLFSDTGHMVTGWYTDALGNTYYLNPVSDNTLGRMLTGWHWIDKNCYYFNDKSDGTEGVMKRDTVTLDGYRINALGVWVDHSGSAQIQAEEVEG